MKRFVSILTFTLAASTLFISCNKSNDEPVKESISGYYILNNGSMGQNNSEVSLYDVTSHTVLGGMFLSINGKSLGDTAQDILAYGDDIYISVNLSKVVFVTDKNLLVKKEIVAKLSDGTVLSPRYLTAAAGKVYVTYYEGYLGEIDPATYVVRTTPVGPNPEGCAYAAGKVFVANSGGYLYPTYNNTVSIVDPTQFKEVSTITVNTNPATMKAYGDKVYFLSLGDYATTPSMVQCIDASTQKLTDLDYESPSAIALSGSNLFVMCGGYDENWNPLPGMVYKHDAETNTALGAFVKDNTSLPQAYSLSAAGDYLWVGCSDYKTNGDVYVFTLDGYYFDKFDSQGLNPIAVAAK